MFVAEGVRDLCDGESEEFLESVCMKLPADDKCYSGREEWRREDACDLYEFECGNHECIDGLKVCDRKFDCSDHSDELRW